jgi:uncharacterized protein with ParB-like and HNH nuclease domain
MSFSIDAGTFVLCAKTKGSKSILDSSKQYVIPIYQRPYSWTEHQLTKFISDIFSSFSGYDGGSLPEAMFIGTMQLSKKNDLGKQDIIDGQQRLSTFLILIKTLQLMYPTSFLLNDFKFDWLTTKVNNGKEQQYLNEFLISDSLELDSECLLNPYKKNAVLIHKELVKHITLNEEASEFDIGSFIGYLYSNIYFVVIETQASLAKTLQIFDTINTTGLDLSSGDVFKIRMYEYLNKDGTKDHVFNDISKLYEKIETNNEKFSREVSTINNILGIYKYYLIAKYKLPVILYNLATTTFYDRLFETLFNINKWEYFKNNVENNKLVLCLDEIDKIIDTRYEWEAKWSKGDYGNAENAAIIHLWTWSRYSKYNVLNYVFLNRFYDDEDKFEMLYIFSNQLVKLYLYFSLKYQKSVNEIKATFNNKLIELIINESFESIINFINMKMNEQNLEKLKETISGNVVAVPTMKNILCRLSALLQEDREVTDKAGILVLREKLFLTKFDIEHIQPCNDEDLNIRQKIKDEWGSDLHSLGNLVLLEHDINRRIGNKSDKKLAGYKESKLRAVNVSVASLYPTWNRDVVKIRKEKEVNKVINYLCDIPE